MNNDPLNTDPLKVIPPCPMDEPPPTPIEALLSIQFDCEMARKDGGYDGVVPTIHETANAALVAAGITIDRVSPAAEPRRWHDLMRETYLSLCWCWVIDADGDDALCMRERGHDSGMHEPIQPDDSKE